MAQVAHSRAGGSGSCQAPKEEKREVRLIIEKPSGKWAVSVRFIILQLFKSSAEFEIKFLLKFQRRTVFLN